MGKKFACHRIMSLIYYQKFYELPEMADYLLCNDQNLILKSLVSQAFVISQNSLLKYFIQKNRCFFKAISIFFY